jgi:translocation protein SEC66
MLDRAHALAPWFPHHKSRDIYLSLLHIDDTTPDGKPVVPDSLLKAALLRRAQEDVQRVVQLRNTKPALSTLLQRGSIGDDLWTRFVRAEQELEGEVREVMDEVITPILF